MRMFVSPDVEVLMDSSRYLVAGASRAFYVRASVDFTIRCILRSTSASLRPTDLPYDSLTCSHDLTLTSNSCIPAWVRYHCIINHLVFYVHSTAPVI